MSRPRVLGIGANYYVRGGSDRYFLEHERLLRRQGCEIVPFAARHAENRPTDAATYFPPAPDVDRPGAHDALRYIFNPAARKALDELLGSTSFDVAHLQIYQGRLTSSILAPLNDHGIPIVQTLHDFKPICPAQGLQSGDEYCDACRGRSFWKVLAKRCKQGSIARSGVSMLEAYTASRLGMVEAVDRFIAVCEFQFRKLVELGIPESAIETLHNFVTSEAVAPATASGEYFLYFGRLTADKGLFTLLEALARRPSLRLVIAGRGPAGEALEQRATDLRLANVRFVGFHDDAALADLIRGSIATVLPAQALELCSMSILESFALGRAVVATRVGGNPELVRDRLEGLLVAPGSTDELGEALESLAANPSAAVEMGRNARRSAERRFGPERHFERLLAIYRRVIG